MSGANAALSLPPGDRDEAPELPMEAAAPAAYAAQAAQVALPVGDDAPPLTDETDEARIARWIAANATANRYLGEALALLAAGRHAQYASALHHYDKSNTEAGALARVLSKSFTAKR